MKTWSVVQFTSDTRDIEEVATIPSKWIVRDLAKDDQEMHCYWPNKQPRKYIQKQTDPLDSWLLYKINSIRFETDLYEDALKFEKMCSGSSTEGELLHGFEKSEVRKRKRLKVSDDFLSDLSDGELERNYIPAFPKPPPVPSVIIEHFEKPDETPENEASSSYTDTVPENQSIPSTSSSNFCMQSFDSNVTKDDVTITENTLVAGNHILHTGRIQ